MYISAIPAVQKVVQRDNELVSRYNDFFEVGRNFDEAIKWSGNIAGSFADFIKNRTSEIRNGDESVRPFLKSALTEYVKIPAEQTPFCVTVRSQQTDHPCPPLPGVSRDGKLRYSVFKSFHSAIMARCAYR